MSDGNGDSFVRITNREIWEEIRNLDDRVKSMDSRMNAILGENVELRARIRALELKTYTLLAGFTTALIAASLALTKGVFG